jgi:hypothetical protein
MKTRHSSLCKDAESSLQERFNLIAWLVFRLVALWASASYWWQFKRVCAWHQPKPCYMGGNPLARRSTHGLCPQCFVRISHELISHGEPEGPLLQAPSADLLGGPGNEHSVEMLSTVNK